MCINMITKKAKNEQIVGQSDEEYLKSVGDCETET